MNESQNNINIGSVQTALKSHRDSIGKETRPCHYINEVRLIYYAVMGHCKPPCNLKSLPREKNPLVRRVICMNRRLINLHVDYELRKQACRDLVLKNEAKSKIQKPHNPVHWEGGFVRAFVEADAHILRSSQCFGNAAFTKERT